MEISNLELYQALEENTAICRELVNMLQENCNHTSFLYERKKVDLTGSQQTKDFGMNVLANVVGDYLSFNK